AAAQGGTDRAAGGDRHDLAACGVRDGDAAARPHGASRGRGECVALVRAVLPDRETSGVGVAEMRLLAIGYWLSVLALCAAPVAAQTSLSIHRDGRVVVRRTLAQALQQGRNSLTLRLEALDPATLFSPDSSVSLSSATVRYPSTANDALARAIGQTLPFVRSVGDTVRATVVRVDPPQYK